MIARRELLIILLLILVAIRGFWLASVMPAPGIDYYQFWLVGQAERRACIGRTAGGGDEERLQGV
jgi:hypothetical protein